MLLRIAVRSLTVAARNGCWLAVAVAAMFGQQASDCSIDGTTVNAITGEIVPRALITLTGQGGVTSVTADSSGNWRFTNVSCGLTQVGATRPGFTGPAFHRVTLAAASAEHGITLKLTPQAVIAGRVQDDQSDPVQNAQVSAMVSRVIQGKRVFQQAGSASTNDLGEYRISGLTAGSYIVCANGPMTPNSVNEAANGDRCFLGPADGGLANAMPVPAGHDSRVDLTLPRVHLVHISGTVTGMPANMRASLSLVKRPGGSIPKTAVFRPDGRFTINGVAAGSYTLSTDYFDSGKRLIARVPLEVGSSDVEGISVHLEPGFSVTATVRVESAKAAGLSDRPSSFLLRSADPTLGGGTIQWNEDRSGFTMNDLPPGTYTLEGSVAPPLYVKSAMMGGRDIAREPVQITQAPGPIDIVLSDDGGTLEGVVSGADDQPAEATVTVLQGAKPARWANAGPNGHFTLAGLAPGDYVVYAWENIDSVEYANPEWLRRYSPTAVSIQAGQTAQVQLKRLSVVSQ